MININDISEDYMKDFSESAQAANINNGVVSQNHTHSEQAQAHGRYTVECLDANGNVKWNETINNLVTTQGKNFALDTLFSGSNFTSTWYLGLISATGYTGIVASDTASSHTGWTEDVNYSQQTRVTPAFSSATGGSKTTSAAVMYTINATTTIKGSRNNSSRLAISDGSKE
jgi:hypothetical protein